VRPHFRSGQLRLASLTDLDGLGLTPEQLASVKRQLEPAVSSTKPTTIVGFVAQAKALRIDIREADKAIKIAEGRRTALHCRYGRVLLAIKTGCKHGQWLPTLQEIGETNARALEYIKVYQLYSDFGKLPDEVAEAEALRHSVTQTQHAYRRDPRFYNIYENCFATPQWLRDVVTRDYGFPGLDVASSHGMHFGERFYAPRQFDEDGNIDPAGVGAIGYDGLKQDWKRDCSKGKIAWCNAPYFRDVLHAFLEKCHAESERKLTVVGFSPCWSEWHKNLINQYAEVRYSTKPVVCEGFGPKEGKPSHCKRNDAQLFIFRPKQLYFRGLDVAPAGSVRGEMQATGEISQLEKTLGQYGKYRATPKPLKTVPRTPSERQARIEAVTLIHGDCRKELKDIESQSVDAVITDPIYPEVSRQYGRITEAEWHGLMRVVVHECRRILRPEGSAVFILQPNAEKIGKMRLWLWRFLVWAGENWNLVEDAYWWNPTAIPVRGATREHGLMRPSVKMCVWLGSPECYRNQDGVLWTPSDALAAMRREDRACRISPSGRTRRSSTITAAADERGGTTPFNLIPISPANLHAEDHPAATPYDVAAWWCRYILPPGGVLLDPFVGSGTMLLAGLDQGASRVIGIDKKSEYIQIAKRRIAKG
jgi:hypothetical protein